LGLSAYDDKLKDLSIENVLSQCLNIISILPRFAVYSYLSHNYFNNGKSLHIHYHDEKLTLPENFLQMLRLDSGYSELEARLLDLCLILQMDHGGGNNSTFTTRVVTSSGADTYMTMTAALSSLSGPKHGGANLRVHQMFDDIKNNVKDISNKEEVKDYLNKILNKKAFDKQGLIYGIGHPVYSLSDPRAQILKRCAKDLAIEKNTLDEYNLYTLVEEIGLELVQSITNKQVCVNVDFYIGFVYSVLNIPEELYTPLFAIARCVGWSAHRLEELVNGGKIIRPSYESV
jgi:citrate synthase